MGAVVAIGDDRALDGFALAGVVVVRAHSPVQAVEAWHGLAPDVSLVILSAEAADALGDALGERPEVLTAVLP